LTSVEHATSELPMEFSACPTVPGVRACPQTVMAEAPSAAPSDAAEPRLSTPGRPRHGASHRSSGRNPFLDAAFRSPSAMIHLSANLRGRVNVPGLHLRNDSETFTGPFGLKLPSPFGFFMACAGYDPCSRPVASSDSETQRLYSDLRSPSGFPNKIFSSVSIENNDQTRMKINCPSTQETL
jgi:hypothetical protein